MRPTNDYRCSAEFCLPPLRRGGRGGLLETEHFVPRHYNPPRPPLRKGGRELLAIVAIFLAGPFARADLLIEKPLVNLGDIKGGVPLQHRLELSNNGALTID